MPDVAQMCRMAIENAPAAARGDVSAKDYNHLREIYVLTLKECIKAAEAPKK